MSDKKRPDEKANGNLPREVILNAEALDKLKRASVDNPGLIKFAHNLSSGKIVPLEEGAIRSNSLMAMTEQISMQMDQIIAQIKLLAGQVEELQQRKNISELVYTAKLTFEPVVGKMYFLYQSEERQERFLSMIAPEEWGRQLEDKKLKFLAQVKLLSDRTWKIIDATKDFPVIEGVED
jgi:hypothetical protein